MQQIIFLIYKTLRQAKLMYMMFFWRNTVSILFYCNNIQYGSLKALGKPRIKVSRGAKVEIGSNFNIRSSEKYTDTGENRPCKLLIWKNGNLKIGNNVGISSSTIACQNSITIGNDVLIGGGSMIMDTNFHSIDSQERRYNSLGVKTAPVTIGNNVFLGYSTTICKGVSIGENSIIAACSVVCCNIPANEIWGGNPAKFINKIEK